MDFQVTQQNDQTVISLSGQFTFTDAQRFKSLVNAVLDNHADAVNLDFADVTFIDSAGMGMLLLLRDECQTQNTPITISSAQGQVGKVFMISKFDQLFSMPS